MVFTELSGGKFPGVAAHWPIHQGWIRSALDSQWHFLLQQDGKTELYHWPDDPLDEHNLSGTPKLAAEESRLRELLRGLQPPCHGPP